MKAWQFQYGRAMVYLGAAIAAVGIVIASRLQSPSFEQTLVSVRQLFGLWALGLLLASMILGPLAFVLPWLPLKSALLYSRRAIGICALIFALIHVACYLWSVLRRNWRELYSPGPLWWAGLLIGVVAMGGMLALGLTSTDNAVKRMGGRKWKRMHRTVYFILPLAMIHAFFVGADFGLNHAPDVKGEADFGSGIAFVSVGVAWVLLFILRSKRVRWQRTIDPTPA